MVFRKQPLQESEGTTSSRENFLNTMVKLATLLALTTHNQRIVNQGSNLE